MASFEQELRELINRQSAESESNTPDFILAQYIIGVLSAFNEAVQHREAWYGRRQRETWLGCDPRPTERPIKDTVSE